MRKVILTSLLAASFAFAADPSSPDAAIAAIPYAPKDAAGLKCSDVSALRAKLVAINQQQMQSMATSAGTAVQQHAQAVSDKDGKALRLLQEGDVQQCLFTDQSFATVMGPQLETFNAKIEEMRGYERTEADGKCAIKGTGAEGDAALDPKCVKEVADYWKKRRTSEANALLARIAADWAKTKDSAKDCVGRREAAANANKDSSLPIARSQAMQFHAMNWSAPGRLTDLYLQFCQPIEEAVSK